MRKLIKVVDMDTNQEYVHAAAPVDALISRWLVENKGLIQHVTPHFEPVQHKE